MYYKEQLEKAKKYGVDWLSINVANEVQSVFDIELTEKDFERCCSLIEQAYLKSEYSNVLHLTKALYDMITDTDNEYKTINELMENITTWELIEKASWYD